MVRTYALLLVAIIAFGAGFAYAEPVEEELKGVVSIELETLSIVAAEDEWQRNNAKVAAKPPPPETGSGIQATFNVQGAMTAHALEGTANPEASPVAEADIVATLTPDEPDNTPVPAVLGAVTGFTETNTGESVWEDVMGGMFIAGAASLYVIDGDITEGQIAEPDSVDVITAAPLESVPTVIAEVEREPTAGFSFALTGKQVPAQKTRTTSEGFSTEDEEIETSLTPIIDSETGVMNIAGECTDAYFVVLLFKGERDYRRDPRSYVLTQTHPCEGGQFAYSISELPYTLPSGTYYLLIAQQGEQGPWTPITSLNEITINRD